MKHRIIFGNVEDVLRSLEPESVDCCITSPPYWGLRSYSDDPREIGKEPTPEAYVERLVGVFREVRRVLKATGTVWLNLGDSYATQPAGNKTPSGFQQKSTAGTVGALVQYGGHSVGTIAPGLKPKDLVGIPWRVALALQADGWWLRNDIIWAKPNAMPESCKDRFSCKHEHWFLLTKSARYCFDLDAVREKPLPESKARQERADSLRERTGHSMTEANKYFGSGMTADDARMSSDPLGKNPGDMWMVPTQPTPFAHFATFPEALVERCLLAGCPPTICGECGVPWEHRVEVMSNYTQRETAHAPRSTPSKVDSTGWKTPGAEDLGYHPGCSCGGETVAGLVLDPFAGSGTVTQVARKHGRRSIGIELQREYEAVMRERLDLGGMFSEVEFEDGDDG